MIKVKNFCPTEDTLEREYKGKPQKGSKYLANCVLDTGLVFRIYKEPNTMKI